MSLILPSRKDLYEKLSLFVIDDNYVVISFMFEQFRITIGVGFGSLVLLLFCCSAMLPLPCSQLSLGNILLLSSVVFSALRFECAILGNSSWRIFIFPIMCLPDCQCWHFGAFRTVFVAF